LIEWERWWLLIAVRYRMGRDRLLLTNILVRITQYSTMEYLRIIKPRVVVLPRFQNNHLILQTPQNFVIQHRRLTKQLLLILLNILIRFVSRFFVLDQKMAKIYAAARPGGYRPTSRLYLLLLLLGLLLPFLLELLLGYVGSTFSNLSAYFAPLVGLTVLLFRWWLPASLLRNLK
jgi:uncharacterized BrkB/YihY/UPF0761 family membrane protein